MTGPLYHLGRFCARHHRLIIAAWIVAAVGLALAGRAAGERTSDDLTLPGTGSTKATDVLEQRLPDQAYGSNPLVIESPHGKLTDSKNNQAVDDTVKKVRNTPHVVKAVNPDDSPGEAATMFGRNDTVYVSMWTASAPVGTEVTARWFGPALIGGLWSDAIVWTVGPIAGGIIASVVYTRVFLQGRDPAAP
mgnify:CR=1 FL=1